MDSIPIYQLMCETAVTLFYIFFADVSCILSKKYSNFMEFFYFSCMFEKRKITEKDGKFLKKQVNILL